MKRCKGTKRWRIRRRRKISRAKVGSVLGFVLEEHALFLLRFAVRAGFVKEVQRTQRHGGLDTVNKWDIVIVHNDGVISGLQVKSNEDDARVFRKRNPDTPVYVARLNESPQSAIRRLQEALPFLRGESNYRKMLAAYREWEEAQRIEPQQERREVCAAQTAVTV